MQALVFLQNPMALWPAACALAGMIETLALKRKTRGMETIVIGMVRAFFRLSATWISPVCKTGLV